MLALLVHDKESYGFDLRRPNCASDGAIRSKPTENKSNPS